MIASILSWFLGSGIKELAGLYTKYKDSENADEQRQAVWAKSQLDAMLAVRQSTSSYWEMRAVTAVIASVFTCHLVLVALDTMFQWTWNGRHVDKFPQPFDAWEGSILLSFFGLTAGVIGIKAIAGAISRR